jgi:hypothetical protein
MNERLETLKKARERMVEERDAHAKVLAAPFDRDKAERARTQQIHRDTAGDRRAGPRHRRRGRSLAGGLSVRQAQPAKTIQTNAWLLGNKGRTVGVLIEPRRQ